MSLMQVHTSDKFVGRVPNVKKLNLDAVGVELHEDGAIKVCMLYVSHNNHVQFFYSRSLSY